jgi:methyl-accepting chemotaxis protein
MSKGNLTIDLHDTEGDEISELYNSFHRMQMLLTDVIHGIRIGAYEVAQSSEQVSKGNTDLSQRTQEQASSLEEIASSMEQMTSTVNQTADNALHANKLSVAAREQAEKGGEVTSRAVGAMDTITASSKKIAEIINVIDEIAFQTNLLALNASVEAARAGEQGRGFAVVAGEVRNLAGRCKTAAQEIKALIKDSVDKVQDGTKLVNESKTSLDEIILSVKKVSDIVAEIAAASQEQADGIKQAEVSFDYANQVEKIHAALYEKAMAELGKNKEVDYYVCPVCGNTVEGKAPDKCPICDTAGSKFIRVS